MSETLRNMRKEFEEDYMDDDTLVKLGYIGGVESIQNERENDYGDALVSHASIANFWNEYLSRRFGVDILGVEIDSTDVAVMLSLMKVSRLAYKRKHDSFLDFASYADFALQFEDGKS